ncbi:MAG TPA: glycoside hydrolase family 15 protein [Sphingomicrobium sp.]|nr:glycoside hydrolase family 15 protein [Sphingomicrobium sp.]
MIDSIISNAVRVLAGIIIALAFCVPAFGSHLVTGNGFGFAVVAPESGLATKFYSHPYSFVRRDPANPLSEGIEATNFIKKLGWGRTGQKGIAQYLDDSHVIGMSTDSGAGYFFMPFGFERPALIISLAAAPRSQASWKVEWNAPLRSRKVVSAAGADGSLLRFEGIDEPLLLIPLGGLRKRMAPVDQPLAASSAWALISLQNESEAGSAIRDFVRWREGLAARDLVKREIAELELWRAKPAVHFKSDKERHLWRQSEVMLRIAQSREPNRSDRHGNGLIVASLPDGVWFTPWVRDMAWATVALARMGHRAEARAALLAYFNAQPTGKMRAQVNDADYQISVVRYFGNGEEEPFFTMEGSTNIEFDDWGEALWALGEYLRMYDDRSILKAVTYRGPLYETARDFIVKPLMANTERYGDGLIVAPDTSIWEERQKDKKHFAFSTAMAIVALREFAEVAQRAGDDVAHQDALDQLGLLEKGFDAAFIRNGELHGTLEEGIKNDIDGALIPIINFGIVRDPRLIRNTVKRMSLLKVASGGYRRVHSTYTDPAIFEYWYERQEFLFVDLALAQLYRKLGRKTDSDAMLERIVDKAAADHDIIPEMYVALPCKLFPGRIGDPTGALPMVGYGAGAYVLHLLEREPRGARG